MEEEEKVEEVEEEKEEEEEEEEEEDDDKWWCSFRRIELGGGRYRFSVKFHSRPHGLLKSYLLTLKRIAK
ncbi:hypothetical protein STEG23_001211 [Scotinomys teguina]